MKKSLSTFFLLIFLSVSFTKVVVAQNVKDSLKTKIETLDGNEYIGVVLERTDEKVRIKTEKLGEIVISVSEIKHISEVTVTRAKNGTYWTDNPQATRYLWAPNGYNLKKDEGYYQNAWIFFNQAVYGFSNHFSAGVGVVPLFIFGGVPTPVWVTAKLSVPVVENKFNLGAGALMGTSIGQNNSGFGILYGVSTFGSRDKNISIGLGWGYAAGEMAKDPTINISGMIRTGPRGYLLTENYLVGTPDNILILMSVGGRSIIRHISLDYGGIIPFGNTVGGFIVIPWLGFTIPFGAKSSPVKN